MMNVPMTMSEPPAEAPASPAPVAAGSTQVRAAVERASLCDALDRLLTTGVVIVADATLTVANIDLLRLQLQLVVSAAGDQQGA